MGKATFLLLVVTVLVAFGYSDSEEAPKWKIADNAGGPTDSAASSSPVDGRSFEPQDGRKGKNLLDLIGFGTGPETDPYLASANAACLTGDLAECFKSRALASMDDFFQQESYQFGEHARVVRLRRWREEEQARSRGERAYEFSSAPRAGESEWDQFSKFILRKAEAFIKSTAFEVNVPHELLGQEEGRYAPRFIDEIASEIDIIEDKTESSFSRTRLKKLFIPLLIILKLFKLKLLLFLPFILGLASFKKLLGLMALVIPGLIGFYKLCKPDLHGGYGNYGHSNYYGQPPIAHQYSPYSGYGGNSYYSRDNQALAAAASSPAASSPVAFRDPDDRRDAQQLAYQGYSQYN
ncbi:hypothetical protein B566_EDAN009215 [Ephemera danica]|nr:hypothetical protein B566_EDAN009215 [Ephemera danica]